MKEVWKDVKDYEGLYQISNLGRVKCLPKIVHYSDGRKRRYKEIIKKPFKNKSGYIQTTLTKDKKSNNKYIHRLVAEAFIPNPENKPEVNHIDENKGNNHLSNLEWVTEKENSNHGTSIERMTKSLSKKVAMICPDTNKIINIFNSTQDAYLYLGKQRGGYLSQACYKEVETAFGYKWEYIS